jgi:spore maturation protein CgeB
MKILYVAPKYDYGKPERGFSFEHYNFFDTLFNMGNDIVYFDYMDLLKRVGRTRMNELLLETVHAEKPELMFVFLFEYELDPKVISRISNLCKAVTINWFADDHWRFDNFSRYWAPCFNWVVTTDAAAVPKYHSIGIRNVILSQWACNHFLYKNLKLQPSYDVSFIGQAYGNRREVVKSVERAGVPVLARGQGWDAGRATQDEMIQIINRSRINLNMANASVNYGGGWVRLLDKYALYNPLLKRIWRRARSLVPSSSARRQPIFQIKGRNFEVPGCGGFFLTDYVKGLEEFYQPDGDIVCYRSTDELIEKIHYYLSHEEERNRIASNGYKVTMERHTYVHRFNHLFREMGLECRYSLDPKNGSLTEVSA